MRAIVIKQPGGPEVLALEERPDPVPRPDQVLIEVKAFGLNHAESYFRSGSWANSAQITGIECVGIVKEDPSGHFTAGQTVVTLVGGLARSLNGSYAELVAAPRTNVAAVKTKLSWEALAALPESYGTAWTAMMGILGIKRGEVVLIRGATSALGQAAINIALHAGAQVIATTRSEGRRAILEELGAHEVLVDTARLSERLEVRPDAVLDIVGTTTILDSLAALRRGGRGCQVGFLGGGVALNVEPVFQIPNGRHYSTFASAAATGTPDFPLTEIPFQDIVERVAAGIYRAKPSRVFRFDEQEIREAHRILDQGSQMAKMVVRVA
jgi:NADPH:quinone reductase-like Zn-dependent oxidoreductase